MELLKRIIAFVMDTLETVIFIASIFVVIYLFIMSPHQVKGASMEPTFQSSDYILTSKISYRTGAPQRGDVIVFKSPKNPDIDYIKRIIAAPGDKILIKDFEVYVNGTLLEEQYIASKTSLFPGGFVQEGVEVVVPENYLFAMGDNRPRSSDSREFGFIPMKDVIGKVFFRYFPLNKIGQVKNPSF
ncbi:MAG TPA: signal peptidase I [Patescibacteria group bacterium]|nr:signal peptidase I [Patescibacteria group bacterium]